jgi:uncharacterized membrane protein YiaA
VVTLLYVLRLCSGVLLISLGTYGSWTALPANGLHLLALVLTASGVALLCRKERFEETPTIDTSEGDAWT